MKKNKDFIIAVKVILDTTVEIKAESLEEALKQGRELGLRDVVEFDGDFNDGSIEVTGVF